MLYKSTKTFIEEKITLELKPKRSFDSSQCILCFQLPACKECLIKGANPKGNIFASESAHFDLKK